MTAILLLFGNRKVKKTRRNGGREEGRREDRNKDSTCVLHHVRHCHTEQRGTEGRKSLHDLCNHRYLICLLMDSTLMHVSDMENWECCER